MVACYFFWFFRFGAAIFNRAFWWLFPFFRRLDWCLDFRALLRAFELRLGLMQLLLLGWRDLSNFKLWRFVWWNWRESLRAPTWVSSYWRRMLHLNLRCLQCCVGIVILLNVLFQPLRSFYSLSARACCVRLMLSWENLKLNCIISFINYAATLWFLITTRSKRNDLICSLTHLMVIIVSTVETELVLWVALGYRSTLNFATRWLQIWILLHQLQLSFLVKHRTRISNQLAPTFQRIRPINIRVYESCCLLRLPGRLLNLFPLQDCIWLRSIGNVGRARTLWLELLPLWAFDLAIHLRILRRHSLNSW